MAIADMDTVKSLLLDLEGRIRSVVDRAWTDWLAFPERGRLVYVGRMRANFVFDRIIYYARQEFDGDPDIRAIVKSQTVHFMIKGVVYIRFKKGNTRGVGSNIETQSVIDFTDPQRSLPGLLPDILKVEICYQPDDLGIGMQDVAVVARDRKRRIWAYPIDKATGADILPMPMPTPDERPPAVTPKRLPKKGTGTEDE